MGHLAGVLLTTPVFLLTLASFGDFPLKSARIAGPGIYTYMTRPVITEPDYSNTSGLMTSRGSYEDYMLTNLTAGSARLNDHTLADFADNEMEATHEDSLSVVTSMDAEGRGAIEGVLHTPRDRKLFMRFGQLLSTSQFDLPPAQTNPRGRVVWSFSRIFVTS